jgi:hypothetical protein
LNKDLPVDILKNLYIAIPEITTAEITSKFIKVVEINAKIKETLNDKTNGLAVDRNIALTVKPNIESVNSIKKKG